ncbi:unnamed protein product [Ceutorhynchus assimilis]|uniref:Uncharacterized protein n=1 Tax=Ceutorhynchus assimilis TaxID=467358 RepID=A0A9P0DHM9_9CUCU|nr:unnamed protein product [Ceutorhynchus assimilis]
MIRVIVLFYLFLITETNGKDLFEKEQDMLGKNLKPKPIPTTTEHLLNSKNPFIKHQKQIKERRKRAISPMYDNRQMNLNNQNEFLESQQKEIENKQPVCTKTNEEIVAEKQKLDQLKAEVQKLNELISLLKDQQTMMKKIGPENNVEVNALESSFLYKTIKMLEDERKNKQSSDSQINQELNRIKLNLQKTEDTLNKTQEILLSDRDREEVLENEIKRHNTDLKFLKVMMENLYDKTYSNKQKRLEPKIIKADDYEDNTTNTILGAMHMNRNPLESLQDQLEVTLRDNQQNTEKFLRHLAEEQDNIRRQLYFQNTRNGGRFQEGFMNNQRRSAPERLKKSQITRDSEQTDENQNNNMHRLLTMLSKQDNPSDVHQIPETNEQIKTNGSEFGRASSKSDDIDFKLKVIEILNKEGKSDEEKKEKQLQEGLLKLLKPEKKTTDSDEDALLALMTLLPKKTSSQSSLTKLIEALRPQGKSDDFEVDEELRQLQKAINSLKPKQDNFDLGNNRPAKDDSQNFQVRNNI